MYSICVMKAPPPHPSTQQAFLKPMNGYYRDLPSSLAQTNLHLLPESDGYILSFVREKRKPFELA